MLLILKGVDYHRMRPVVIVIVLLCAILVLFKFDEHIEEWHLDRLRSRSIKWDTEAVTRGRRVAATSSINFCFIARDCADAVRRNIDVIEGWGTRFAQYRVVAFENDSEDDTREVLRHWARNNNRVVLLECPAVSECRFSEKRGYTLGQFSHSRIQKMGNYRERYLNAVRNSDFEFTMVIDIDIDLPGVPIEGMYHALSKTDDWDAIFHNGRVAIPGTWGTLTIPYDAMAFEAEGDMSKITGFVAWKMLRNYWRLRRVYASGDFVRVQSAFNGLALYRTSALRNASYKNDGSVICEHNVLHARMTNKFACAPWIGYHLKQGDGSVLKQARNLFLGR